ncbi:arsenate reductase family protein [Capnocytophaga canimorsus]|uniref:arsenate reductase family protein n=1 Tax=Capnocytophaga canimorsus TaxID=28188 RepID=UPI00385F5301
MNKIYHLGSCSTCQRILKELQPSSNFEIQDIKHNPITESELDFLKEKAGSYEKLFSKRAQLYKQRNLKEQSLTESDYKNWLNGQNGCKNLCYALYYKGL